MTAPPESTAPPTEPTWPDLEDEDFVRIVDLIPSVRQELRYGTENNFTGQVIYEFSDAFLRFGTVKKLAQACLELGEQGLGIVIWDAFRPVYAQQKLWDVCPDPTYVSPPGTGRQTHCRGVAVDVTLCDLQTGELLEMPSDFDEFSALGDRDYSDGSEEARKNALILENAMKNAGFAPYAGEWWHFADTVDYALEEQFDPAEPQIWVANCNQYINLRDSFGGVSVGRIPKGESFQLLQWKEKQAKVLYRGQVGWVSAAYMMPQDQWVEKQLEVLELTACYSHGELLQDLGILTEKYPDLTDLYTAGHSGLGREIPVLRIGDPEAEHHALIHGAIHGREHATAWLLMAMAETWLKEGGFENLCIHILPMVNPDGVTISQSGALDDPLRQIYKADWQGGYTRGEEAEYARLWKSNGSGVDINRNFPAGWDILKDRGAPSCQKYRGTQPFSTAEAQVLRDYTLRYEFDVTLSYHASGSVCYYDYGNYREVNSKGLALAQAFWRISGYIPLETGALSGGGYKEWAISELGIPSLTVEIGCSAAPLHQRELYSAYVRNVTMGEVLAEFLKNEE